MFKYEIKDGSYYLMRGTEIVLMTDQVAFAYDDTIGPESVVMHKHGNPQYVKDWMVKTNREMATAGVDWRIKMVKLPRGFPVEVLNRVLDTTGYLMFVLRDINAGKYDHLGSKIDLF